MPWTFYEKRYGKEEFQNKSDNHSGYYRYNIEMYNPELIKALQLEDRSREFHFYDVLSIEEVESLFGMHWLQETNSVKDLHGKIHVCGPQNHEESLNKLYKLFINKLTIEWGYLTGVDYDIEELGFIQLDPKIDFKKNYWLLENSINPNVMHGREHKYRFKLSDFKVD